jgi:hypothetical protein
MAMVLGGAAAGAAGQAGAVVFTDTFNYAAPTDGTVFSYDVTLTHVDDVTMTFTGGAQDVLTGVGFVPGVKHHLNGNGTVRFDDTAYSAPSIRNEGFYTKDGIDTYVQPFEVGPLLTTSSVDPTTFYHLTFTSGGKDYFGSVGFNDDHSLNNVVYATGAPEPATWSLLILGAGLAGAGLRRARRLAQAA